MGIYGKYIFPRIVEWLLGDAELGALRGRLLKTVSGKVLEVGFGTGLNLPHYPDSVKELHIVDPNPGMHALALRRMAKSGLKIKGHVLKGEKLPFADETFDAVVTAFTLCSIPEVGQALCEMRRVLKPGGTFFFLEHGWSDDPKVNRWQSRLTPVQKVLADGCHLDRRIDWLVESAGFRVKSLDKFYFPKYPKAVGYLYEGTAVPDGGRKP